MNNQSNKKFDSKAFLTMVLSIIIIVSIIAVFSVLKSDKNTTGDEELDNQIEDTAKEVANDTPEVNSELINKILIKLIGESLIDENILFENKSNKSSKLKNKIKDDEKCRKSLTEIVANILSFSKLLNINPKKLIEYLNSNKDTFNIANA